MLCLYYDTVGGAQNEIVITRYLTVSMLCMQNINKQIVVHTFNFVFHCYCSFVYLRDLGYTA